MVYVPSANGTVNSCPAGSAKLTVGNGSPTAGGSGSSASRYTITKRTGQQRLALGRDLNIEHEQVELHGWFVETELGP
jgi:hypothetical protein